MNDINKSGEEIVVRDRPYSGDFKEYSQFKHNTEMQNIINSQNNVSTFLDNISDILTGMEQQQKQMLSDSKEDSRDFKQLSQVSYDIKSLFEDLPNSKDWKEQTKITNQIMKLLEKNQSKLDKDTVNEVKKLFDQSSDFINASAEAVSQMKKDAKTFSEALGDNLQKVKKNVMDMANTLNLQKLAWGGSSVKELAAMQASAKMTMNVDNKTYMDIQKNLLDQNRDNGFLFSDMKNYLSNMQSYSMKNYNQAQALYKQVTLGTRYLGLSTQNINSIVKATNALADDSYTRRQMTTLAALATDKTTMEDINSLSEFMATNIEGVSARYANGEGIVKESVAIKSAADKLFGSKSTLVTNLMSEIMNTSDFSNLSSSTQELLAMTGNANQTWAQMKSGNLSMPQLIQMIMSGVSNRANTQYGKTIMESYGLSDWVTLSNAYNNNRDEFYKNVDNNLSLIANSNENTAEGLEKQLQKQNENHTWIEKFTDKTLNFFHLQNLDWQVLNEGLQVLQTLFGVTMVGLDITRNIHLLGIKHAIQNQNLSLAGKDSNGVTNTKTTGSIWSTLTHPGSSKFTTGQRLGLGTAGLSMGLYDASAMSEKDGELDLGDVRGFFMGQSASNKSTTHNMISNGANVLKWTAMGAAVGGPWGAAGGAVIGSVLSIIGSFMEDNTEATEDNTKAVKITNDRLQSNSGLSNYYRNNGETGGIGGGTGGSYPTAGSTPFKGTYTGDLYSSDRTHSKDAATRKLYSAGGKYPYSVTSNYGWRRYGGTTWHTGIDFGMPNGTPIGSAVSGTIIDFGNKGNNGGGIVTHIRSDANPKLVYKYFHQSKQPSKNWVRGKTHVNAGDIIGYVGSTGQSTGNHLHFQVDNGRYSQNYNPEPFVTSYIFKPSGKVAGSYGSVADGALAAALGLTGSSNGSDSSTGANSYSDLSSVNGASLTGNSSIKLKKDSLFNMGGATDAANSPAGDTVTPNNYATSADIDRLIEAMQSLNDEQRSNREFMQALAGKNSFTFSMR